VTAPADPSSLPDPPTNPLEPYSVRFGSPVCNA